jgi:hypothetical protein
MPGIYPVHEYDIFIRETRMTLLVPQKTLSTAVKGMSREMGILPDYYVEPNIGDLVKGKDTVKEFAVELIKKSDKGKSNKIILHDVND